MTRGQASGGKGALRAVCDVTRNPASPVTPWPPLLPLCVHLSMYPERPGVYFDIITLFLGDGVWGDLLLSLCTLVFMINTPGNCKNDGVTLKQK